MDVVRLLCGGMRCRLWADGEMENVLRELTDVSVEAGKTILEQGTQGTNFYIVKSGAVDVMQKTGDAEPQKLATLGPGQHFGERALLTDEPTVASVIATEATQLMTLDKKAFERVLPPLQDLISKKVAERDEQAARAARPKILFKDLKLITVLGEGTLPATPRQTNCTGLATAEPRQKTNCTGLATAEPRRPCAAAAPPLRRRCAAAEPRVFRSRCSQARLGACASCSGPTARARSRLRSRRSRRVSSSTTSRWSTSSTRRRSWGSASTPSSSSSSPPTPPRTRCQAHARRRRERHDARCPRLPGFAATLPAALSRSAALPHHLALDRCL
jgi:hypothetical protein